MLTPKEETLKYFRKEWIKNYKTLTPFQKEAYTIIITKFRKAIDNERILSEKEQ